MIIWIFACAVHSIQIIFSDDHYNIFEKKLKSNKPLKNQVVPEKGNQKSLNNVRKRIKNTLSLKDKQTIYSKINNCIPQRYSSSKIRIDKLQANPEQVTPNIPKRKQSSTIKKLKYTLPKRQANKFNTNKPTSSKTSPIKQKINSYLKL